jgi:hypothetical protein
VVAVIVRDGTVRLEDLIELEALVVGAEDVAVPAAVLPEGKEDGVGFEDVEAGGLKGGEGGVDVGDVEGDVVDVAVLAGADLGDRGGGKFVELEGDVVELEHGDVASAFGMGEGGGHGDGEAEAGVEGGGGGEGCDGDADVLEARDAGEWCHDGRLDGEGKMRGSFASLQDDGEEQATAKASARTEADSLRE